MEIESDDAWMRDVGPTFVLDSHGNRRGVGLDVDAWGRPATPRGPPMTQSRNRLLGYRAATPVTARHSCSEGGSIDVDGEAGAHTEECLLDPNRTALTRREIEAHLCEHLGAERIVWLGAGVVEDETSGHVDNLACFVRPAW